MVKSMMIVALVKSVSYGCSQVHVTIMTTKVQQFQIFVTIVSKVSNNYNSSNIHLWLNESVLNESIYDQ